MQSGQILGGLGQQALAGGFDLASAQAQQGAQRGGKIKGPSVPPDSVPILAQGGEGVLHVNMMHELEKSKSKDPLVRKMKKLMGFQAGGPIPTATGNQFLSGLSEAMGGTPIFGNEALENPPGRAGGFPGGGFFAMPGGAPDTAQLVKDQAQAARTRASLLKGLALRSPQGARIQQDALQAEADAQAAETAVAGLAQRETPVKQEVTSTRVVTQQEQEEARREEAQEEAKRIRSEAESVLKAARAPQDKGGQLNLAQAREDLEIRGIDPASVFPGFEAAEQRQQAKIAEAQAAEELKLRGVTGQLQPEFIPQLQALEVALEQGGNIPPDQAQSVAQMVNQFIEMHKSAGRSDAEIAGLVSRLFPNIFSVMQ